MNNDTMSKNILTAGAIFVIAVFVYVCAVPSSARAVVYTSREGLSLDENLSDQGQNTYAPFSGVAVVRISADPGMQFGDSDTWVKGFYYYAITKLGFADVPFNYIVTWQGEVYEMKGGGQDVAPLVDWAASSEIGKVAVVAYFDNNQEATNAGKAGLRDIVSELLSRYDLKKEDITAVDVHLAPNAEGVTLESLVLTKTVDPVWADVVGQVREMSTVTPQSGTVALEGSVDDVSYTETVTAGQNFVVTAKIKNEGDAPWYNTGDHKVMVGTSDPRNHESDFFVTDEWASFTRVGTSTEEWVLPGEIGSFLFEIQTPMIPGEYSDSFELLFLPGNWISGTAFDVDITVEKGDFDLIEILDTETGYLNVRECPSSGCAEVGKVVPGDVLIKKAYQDGWYKIEMDSGDLGWVYGRYAKEL